MEITIKVTGVDEIKRKLAGLSSSVQGKVLQPALNKAGDKGRAEINRAIPQEYAVKASEVRNAVDVRKSRNGDLRTVISVFGSASRRGRSMNMIHFLAAIQAAGAARKTRGAKASKAELRSIANQLGFRIRRDGGLKTIPGAFVGNNGRTIFQRVGDSRLPIEPKQVIGFSQMFASKKINKRVIDRINSELPVEVERALARLLRGM